MQSGDFKQNNLVFAGFKINQDQEDFAVKLYKKVRDAFVLYTNKYVHIGDLGRGLYQYLFSAKNYINFGNDEVGQIKKFLF